MSNIENIRFGVELETIIPRNAPVSIGGYHHGIPATAAPSFSGAYWKAECDGSIMTEVGFQACEFVSPILKGEAGVKHLIEFVAWINTIGGKVNRSCGLHIHIGVESFAHDVNTEANFIRILSRLSTRNATALYAQTGTLNREQGHYCKKADARIRKEISKACSKKRAETLRHSQILGDRYQLLNLCNLPTKRTVEFRCFAGTLNVSKVLCHLLSVMLLCKVAAGRKSLTNWDPSEEPTGTQALHNLLKVRPTFKIIEAAIFETHKQDILSKGFEMAAKYDEYKAMAAGRA